MTKARIKDRLSELARLRRETREAIAEFKSTQADVDRMFEELRAKYRKAELSAG